MHRRRALAKITVPGGARPHRPGPGRCCPPASSGAARASTTVEVTAAPRPANPQAPGLAHRGDRARPIGAARPTTPRPRRSSCGAPTSASRCRPLLDHAPVGLAASRPSGRSGSSPAARACAASGGRWTRRGFTEIQTPKFVASADASRARTSSRSTTSAGRRTSRQSPQFSSSRWSGVFARVYDAGPGVPRRAARHRAAPGGVRRRWTSSTASSTTTATCSRCCATCWPGCSTTCDPHLSRAAGWRRPCRRCSRTIPVVAHRRGAGACATPRPTSRTWLPSTSGALRCVGARQEHGSDFLAVEGYPWRNAARLHAPRQPSDPVAGATAFDLLFRGLELVTRRAAAAPAGRLRAARSGPAARTRRLYAAYLQSFRHVHADRTAASPSASSAGVAGASSRPPTSARSRLFPRDLHRLTPLARRVRGMAAMVGGNGSRPPTILPAAAERARSPGRLNGVSRATCRSPCRRGCSWCGTSRRARRRSLPGLRKWRVTSTSKPPYPTLGKQSAVRRVRVSGPGKL